MDKLQRAKDLLTDIKYAVESGEGEIPVDNNDSSVVEWLVEQAEKVERLEEYISQLESEHEEMSKSLYKILRIANKGLQD